MHNATITPKKNDIVGIIGRTISLELLEEQYCWITTQNNNVVGYQQKKDKNVDSQPESKFIEPVHLKQQTK